MGNQPEHIVQYPKEYSVCTGCHSCELVCSLVHDRAAGPQHGRIHCSMGPVNEMLHTIYACQHCEDAPCYAACPKKDAAMCRDENGIVYVNEDACIGCGKCVKACKFEPSRIHVVKSKDRKQRKAKKCDLCRTREAGPACVQYCPVRCLGLSGAPAPMIGGPEQAGQTSDTPSH